MPLTPPPLCVFQALESLQRAQELADAIGNKVNNLLDTQIRDNLVYVDVPSHCLPLPPPPFGV